MEWEIILALTIGMLVVLLPVAFIWYLNIGGIYKGVKSARVAKQFEKSLSNLTCSVDIDCPLGYVCLGGRCVPKKA